MSLLLKIEVLCYFGIILFQTISGVRGRLTERLFAAPQVAALCLMMLTAGLEANLSSSRPYPFGLLALCVGIIVFAVIGYPIARWIYKAFPPKRPES